MRTQKIALISALVGLSAMWCQSQSTVNFSAAPGQPMVAGISGTALANGNYVAIGYFDPGFNVTSFANNLVVLAGAWNEYGSTTIQTIFGQPGRFAANDTSLDPSFDNQKLYLWIFQTSNNSVPTANYGNVVGYGLYSSTLVNWVFPTQGSTPDDSTTMINSSEVNQSIFGSYDATRLLLQPVPEPGSTALMVLAGLTLLGWRLRRQKL